MKVYSKIANLIHDHKISDDTSELVAKYLQKTGLHSTFTIGPNTDPDGRFFSLFLDFENWSVEAQVFPDLRFGFEIQPVLNRRPDLDDDSTQNLLDHVCKRLQKVLDTDCLFAAA